MDFLADSFADRRDPTADALGEAEEPEVGVVVGSPGSGLVQAPSRRAPLSTRPTVGRLCCAASCAGTCENPKTVIDTRVRIVKSKVFIRDAVRGHSKTISRRLPPFSDSV